MLKILIIGAVLLSTIGTKKAQGRILDVLFDTHIVPVKLKVAPFVQITSKNDIILEQKSENNFEGRVNLVVCNNFPMQIMAEIDSVEIKLADVYTCKLKNSSWNQKVSITTGVHLFHQPKNFMLSARLENVNMGKVAYQDDLLDVAQITITIAPANNW